MKQNISQQITTPKNYVGVKFINLATSEQITCTVTEQTNIDVLVKYFGGMKSYTIEFFEMNIQDGIFVVVPNAPDVKNYVGVKFTNLSDRVIREVFNQDEDSIYYTVYLEDGKTLDKKSSIERFEEYIADGTWIIVPDNSEVLPVRQSIKVDDETVPSVSDTLEDAALKEYPLLNNNWFYASTSQSAFVKGIKSDAAKEYWQKNSCNTYREDEVW